MYVPFTDLELQIVLMNSFSGFLIFSPLLFRAFIPHTPSSSATTTTLIIAPLIIENIFALIIICLLLIQRSIDFDQDIIYWNNGAKLMYGYNNEEVIGCISHELLKTVHYGIQEDIKSILKREEQWSGEIEHTCKDGRKLIIETNHQVIINEIGQKSVLGVRQRLMLKTAT